MGFESLVEHCSIKDVDALRAFLIMGEHNLYNHLHVLSVTVRTEKEQGAAEEMPLRPIGVNCSANRVENYVTREGFSSQS